MHQFNGGFFGPRKGARERDGGLETYEQIPKTAHGRHSPVEAPPAPPRRHLPDAHPSDPRKAVKTLTAGFRAFTCDAGTTFSNPGSHPRFASGLHQGTRPVFATGAGRRAPPATSRRLRTTSWPPPDHRSPASSHPPPAAHPGPRPPHPHPTPTTNTFPLKRPSRNPPTSTPLPLRIPRRITLQLKRPPQTRRYREGPPHHRRRLAGRLQEPPPWQDLRIATESPPDRHRIATG